MAASLAVYVTFTPIAPTTHLLCAVSALSLSSVLLGLYKAYEAGILVGVVAIAVSLAPAVTRQNTSCCRWPLPLSFSLLFPALFLAGRDMFRYATIAFLLYAAYAIRHAGKALHGSAVYGAAALAALVAPHEYVRKLAVMAMLGLLAALGRSAPTCPVVGDFRLVKAGLLLATATLTLQLFQDSFILEALWGVGYMLLASGLAVTLTYKAGWRKITWVEKTRV